MKDQRPKDPRPLAIYARTSREDPDARKVSIEQQIEDGKREATKRELTFDESYIFVDRDKSGKLPPTIWVKNKRAQSRQGLSDLLKTIEQGKVAGVIIRKLDRLARSVKLSLQIFEFLKENGVQLIATDEILPTGDDAASEFTLIVLIGAGQLQRRQISENIKAGKAYQRRKGMKLGGNRLLGYQDSEPGKVVVIPEEKELINAIFKRYDEGWSLCKIAEWLNREHRGLVKHQWTYSTVRIKLTNPLYVGYTSNKKGETIPSAVYEPIVDYDLFMRVQDKLFDNRNTKAGTNLRKHLLSGMLFCGRCSGRLTPYVELCERNGVKRRKWWVYKCRSKHPNRPMGMREDWWEQWVQECIVDQYVPVEEKPKATLPLELKISRLSISRDSARKDSVSAKLSYSAWRELDAEYEAEQNKAMAEIKEIKANQHIFSLRKKWSSLDLEEKREYLRSVVHRIEVFDEGVLVFFKGKTSAFGKVPGMAERYSSDLRIFWPRMLRRDGQGQWGNALCPSSVSKINRLMVYINMPSMGRPVPLVAEIERHNLLLIDGDDSGLFAVKGDFLAGEDERGVYRTHGYSKENMANMFHSGRLINAPDWSRYLGMQFRKPAKQGFKFCNLCGKDKPLSDFNPNGKHMAYACKECVNQSRRQKQTKQVNAPSAPAGLAD